MKRQSDIGDLFRRHEHKLIRRPDQRVWQRLEQRLDQGQRPHRGLFVLRHWSLAAAVAAVAAIIFLLVFMIDRQGTQPLAADHAHYGQPVALEDLQPSEGDPNLLRRVEQTQAEYPARRTIVEGSADRRLVARNEVAATPLSHPAYPEADSAGKGI